MVGRQINQYFHNVNTCTLLYHVADYLEYRTWTIFECNILPEIAMPIINKEVNVRFYPVWQDVKVLLNNLHKKISIIKKTWRNHQVKMKFHWNADNEIQLLRFKTAIQIGVLDQWSSSHFSLLLQIDQNASQLPSAMFCAYLQGRCCNR